MRSFFERLWTRLHPNSPPKGFPPLGTYVHVDTPIEDRGTMPVEYRLDRWMWTRRPDAWHDGAGYYTTDEGVYVPPPEPPTTPDDRLLRCSFAPGYLLPCVRVEVERMTKGFVFRPILNQ